MAGVFGIFWSVIWIALEVTFGISLTIPIAALLGWTIGLGMKTGQRGCSRLGGITTAIIAVLAIAWLNFFTMAMPHDHYAWQAGFHDLPGATIISAVVGLAAAYFTANGALL